jgi:hypothetical protein
LSASPERAERTITGIFDKTALHVFGFVYLPALGFQRQAHEAPDLAFVLDNDGDGDGI